MIHHRLLHRYAATYQGFSKAIWLITLASFFNAMGQMLPLFASLYLKHLNYDIDVIGMIITLYGVGFLIGSYLSGILCDKLPVKHVLSYSMLLNSLCFFAIMLSTNIYWFSIMFFLSGITGSTVRPASVILVSYFAKPCNRIRALGLRRVGINLGMGFAALISGALATINYEWIFLFSGITTLTASLFLINNRALKDKYRKDHAQSDPNNETVAPRNTSEGMKKFWTIVAIYFVAVVVFSQISFTYPIYLVDQFHSGPHLFAYLFALNCFLIVAIEVPLLTYLNQFKQHALMAWGALLLCVGFGILPFGHTAAFAAFSCIIWTVGEILFFPTALNMVFNVIHHKQGKYMGIYQSAYSLGILLAPAIGTVIYNLDQGNILWYICGLVGVLSFVQILWKLKDPKPEQSDTPSKKTWALAFSKRKNSGK